MENEPKFDIAKVIVNNKPKTIIIAMVVVLVIATGVGFWYWSKSKQIQEEGSTLGGQIFDKTQNQLQGQVPDANPLKDQKNPFDAIYKNPFE